MLTAGEANATPSVAVEDLARACASLIGDQADGVESAAVQPAMLRPDEAAPIPAHCEVRGVLDLRTGVDGTSYAIRYHLRLPKEWNGRFLFQGGGGTNGVVGDALGQVGAGRPLAIADGYAIVSQDSGHDNQINNDPDHGGVTAFGRDPVARAAYGGTSLKRVTDAAKSVIGRMYGRPAARSYFYGCSKGGQEGMVLAQRYPDAFDGIVAAAPGFALPRAALAQVWDVQTFAAVAPGGPDPLDFRRLASTFNDAQLAAVRTAILAACDADDGLRDGIVVRFDRCTTARVVPELKRLSCGAEGPCLSDPQIEALVRSLNGPRDAAGRPLYASWPWDAGVGAAGWRVWKLGSPRMPGLDIVTGGPALASIFTVPTTAVRDDPEAFLDYELGFDFERDAARIYATDATFRTSAWEDLSAVSDDLDAFRKHGGKLIVPHGASDPVFSVYDTLDWYARVDRRYAGSAAKFARVFPVPGMNHCAGGPATDSFDAFGALVDWVEHHRAPDRLIASAGPATSWPGRTRPLCPYPQAAIYKGRGSIEQAANFVCKEQP
jgi:hypothetical protein